ncbi:hypothetical protein HYW76_01770 [Candidatus Pacearchaeota archaeon]|nr:hypothetical protein [Candidatus Pacearchaeota archaeon]
MEKEDNLGRIVGIFIVFFSLLFIIFSSNAYAETSNNNVSLEKQAVVCLNESAQIIEEMRAEGFNVIRVNDSFIQAQNSFSVQMSLKEKNKSHDFSLVLPYCKEIEDIKDIAISSLDELTALKKFYNDSVVEGMNTTSVDKLIINIEEEIKNERYEQVKALVDQAYQELINIQSSYTTLNLFYESTTRSLKIFLYKNWIIILSILVILAIFLFIYKRNITRWMIKRKINKLELRKKTLKGLIVQAQEGYFEKGTLSEANYNIRINKFAELVRDIDRQIPLLMEELSRVGGNKDELFGKEKRKIR